MKKLFLDIKTSGFDSAKHGIVQISGIIDIDNTIMDTFNFHCRLIPGDSYDSQVLTNLDLTLEDCSSLDRISPIYSMVSLLDYLNKYINKLDSWDKFNIIGFESYIYIKPFLEEFFKKMGQNYFDSYFWDTPIDIKLISAFITEGYRINIPEISLRNLATYFGFKVEEDKLKDSFYSVYLIRNIYYILEKFKAQVVYIKKVKMS